MLNRHGRGLIFMSFRNVALCLGGLLIGSAGGAIAGYFFAKNKYQALADKEIASVKQVYEDHFKVKNDSDDNPINNETPVNDNPAEEVKPEGNTDYAGMYKGGSVEQELPPDILKGKSSRKSTVATGKKPPYVINGLQFGEIEGYAITNLFYYADKVLADQDGNIINNIHEVVGKDALKQFAGDCDAVYVRDDENKVDYEILLSENNYADRN